uniref:Uncharacterized protein n=1 Tax=Arundo donax TaxID=35708 RepID=A0A0A8ZHA9_ARUDO
MNWACLHCTMPRKRLSSTTKSALYMKDILLQDLVLYCFLVLSYFCPKRTCL